MNTQFYLKIINGFDKIIIESIDYENQTVIVIFPNGNRETVSMDKIVQLEIKPVTFIK